MREIEFRGKYHIMSTDERIWVYGCYNYGDIIDKDDDSLRVDESTIGQWTGLKDRNGKKIFEGDVVTARYYGCSPMTGVVKYSYIRAGYIVAFGDLGQIGLNQAGEREVVGNVFDSKKYKEKLGPAYFAEE